MNVSASFRTSLYIDINVTAFNLAIGEIQSKTCVRFRRRNGDTTIKSYVAIGTKKSTPEEASGYVNGQFI